MMSTTMSDEPQNIYDDPAFFAGYSSLERFGDGWTRAAEHAELLALLPDVAGRRALDLGCGAGQLAHHLAACGAADVVGVDVSERMLELARRQWAHPRVRYQRAAIEGVQFSPAGFDLVVSVLALHYVEDYRGVIARIARWLTPGGVLVYSIEHPLYTARLPGDGWVRGETGAPRWALRDYSDEGARDEAWFVPGVRKFHRTVATLLNGLTDAGLAIARVTEPIPSPAWLERHPSMPDERRRPMFLLVRARKP
jgi:SAM-dependent methyltransferase